MEQPETHHISVVWRGKKFNLEMDATATLKSLGDELLSLTNVRYDTMRLIVPTNKSSKLLYPFSEEHSCLKLEATSIIEGKSIRMLGVPKDEVDDILESAKADLRIVGFEEEEKRLRQKVSNRAQTSVRLPQGPYVFGDFRTLHLPGVELNPPASKALKLMHKLAADPGIVAIMNKHRWRVGIMTEMAPEGYVGISPKCILGFNKNHGEEISLRLRTDDLKGFRKYNSIKDTLLHELSHMVHSEHDSNFYALLRQLTDEAAKLDWTKSRSHTLSGLQHHEEDEDTDDDNHIVSSHMLGGQTPALFDARASSVVAAYSRLAQSSTTHSKMSDLHHESNLDGSVEIDQQSSHIEKKLNDVNIESLEKHNGVVRANFPTDDQIKCEPDPDDYEAGSPMKHEPYREPGSDDCMPTSFVPPLEAKLSEEPDPDDCSAEKHIGSHTSLEPDPDDHAMEIKKTDEPDPDDQELQRIQDPVTIVCSRLQKAVGVLRSQANPLEASRVLQTILKIIRNVIEHPNEVKFRKLRKANPLIQRDVVSYAAATEILSVIGFSEDVVANDAGLTEAYLVLKRNDPGLLWLAKSSLETSIA